MTATDAVAGLATVLEGYDARILALESEIGELRALVDELRSASRDDRTWLDTAQACDYLCCSRATLYRMTLDGTVTKYTFTGKPLYSRAELDEFIRGASHDD